MSEHFFVTGALGCIGAWVVRNLVQEGAPVTVFDLGTKRHRLKLLLSDAELARVHFVQGDITQTETVSRAVQESGATHLIHLAGLQVPFCKANPVLGAAVNVIGTVNVFEAAKAHGIPHLVYASSAAVYGPKEQYSTAILDHDAPLFPQTHYGVYKQANEGTARVYWQDDGVSSIGLRPYVVYGPARDQGMTSTPTKAMLAASQGEGYHIPFGGVAGYQYADDVAQIFILCARTSFRGAEAYNLRGRIVHMREIVAAIEAAAPAVAGRITFDDIPLPFPEGQDDTQLRARLGTVPDTSLEEGVQRTVDHFRRAVADGRLSTTTE